jgi:hypothetical protein
MSCFSLYSGFFCDDSVLTGYIVSVNEGMFYEMHATYRVLSKIGIGHGKLWIRDVLVHVFGSIFNDHLLARHRIRSLSLVLPLWIWFVCLSPLCLVLLGLVDLGVPIFLASVQVFHELLDSRDLVGVRVVATRGHLCLLVRHLQFPLQ